MQRTGIYVQYGCGLSAPGGWLNFDASPTLRIQKTPLVGKLTKGLLNVQFPETVRYGDIVEGLPVADASCDGVYCSHVLEHLSLQDLRTALRNTLRILKPGGMFRLVMPDLETMINAYNEAKAEGDANAALEFIRNTLMGLETRPRGLRALVEGAFGNTQHLWLWDYSAAEKELHAAGFARIRRAAFHDSEDVRFLEVEDPDRFLAAVAVECRR